MTITLFVSILTIGSAITSVLTEAIKRFYANANKEYSANVIALVNAVVVGAGGTAICYILLGKPWTVNNIVCLILMTVAVWTGSMIGYKEVYETLGQIANIPPKEKEEG
jgi:hypothetical protein